MLAVEADVFTLKNSAKMKKSGELQAFSMILIGKFIEPGSAPTTRH
jgi:hypothetical protein